MASKTWFSTCVLAAGVLLFASVRPVAAATITYTETIEDLNFATLLDLFDFTRDLTRTRDFGTGVVDVETNDATIAAENSLSDNWGVTTASTWTWTHLFPLDPPALTFLHGSITLNVIGVDGGIGDFVFLEGVNVGVLTPGGTDVQSTTYFSTDGVGDPDFLIRTVLTDGQLSVSVVPLLFDFMTIRSSIAEVTYEAVPEPATMVMIVSGLAVGGWRRYRSRTGHRNV